MNAEKVVILSGINIMSASIQYADINLSIREIQYHHTQKDLKGSWVKYKSFSAVKRLLYSIMS